MFKAYFEVSLELVRDVVRLCEEEMMVFFDDLVDKLVLVVFNVLILNDTGFFTVSGKLVMLLNNFGSSISVKGVDGRWLIMEVMLQDVIDEMVNNVFQCVDIDKDGKIFFEEFEVWAVNDNMILVWFEVFGIIF